MQISIVGVLWPILSVLAGGMVGYGFGKIQDAAARRYHKLQQDGQFNSSWSIVPGSMRRTAWLLVALALVQLVCPMLFTNGCPMVGFRRGGGRLCRGALPPIPPAHGGSPVSAIGRRPPCLGVRQGAPLG